MSLQEGFRLLGAFTLGTAFALLVVEDVYGFEQLKAFSLFLIPLGIGLGGVATLLESRRRSSIESEMNAIDRKTSNG